MPPRGDADSKHSTGVSPGALSRLLEELAAVSDVRTASHRAALWPGERVGRFEIRRELGAGGFGTVYAAFDPELSREVAVKVLHTGIARRSLSPDALRREAEAVARLNHPSIVTLFEVGRWPGGAFLVMELLQGETLAQRLLRGPLACDEALAVTEQLAVALAHAHIRGVLHRDLKPANVFITDDGRVKLLDFGIAHLLGRAEAAHGCGTPAYMAPEQARGDPSDERTDIYAAGLILVEMLAGVRPGTPRDLPASIPRDVATLARNSRALDPAERPPHGTAWLEAVRQVRRNRTERARRYRVLLVGAGVAALSVVLAGLATLRESRSHVASGPTTVIVADVRNHTSDPELEALSELIQTSLRQSHTVRVLTRDVVAEHARRLGRSADRGDEALARSIGKSAGVRAVLLGSIRKVGETYALEVRALAPDRDEYMFTVLEQGHGKQSVLELVDRTALAVRRALEEPDEDLRTSDEAVSEVVTRSLAAYQAYAVGLRCRERALLGCVEHFERAVAIDPSFAMAHYELAVASFFGPNFKDKGLPAVRGALRHLNRAPEAERIKIRAFAAWAEGRESDAEALYMQALAAHPDDFFVVNRAAWFFMTRDDMARALPLQRRAVELAPVPGMGMPELVDALAAVGKHDELPELERRAEAALSSGGGRHAVQALVVARVNRGDAAGAVEASRIALARAGTDAERADALADAWQTRIHTGDLGVEPEIRSRCDYEATYQLMTLLGLGGRRTEAIRVLEHGERAECPPRTDQAWRQIRDTLFFHASLTRLASGFGDVERARRHAIRAAQRNAVLASHLAVYLAYVGDLATAEELARGLLPGSPRRRAYEAVDLWRRGEREPARAILRELSAQNAWSATPHALPPSFLYGELSAEMGDDAAAIASLERFGALYFYRLDFWSWAYPRSLYLLARSYERTGDTVRARARIARLLGLWRSADPDLPFLDEARELGRQLGVKTEQM